MPVSGMTKLTQTTQISVSGPDAVSFLHSQLTNDIKTLAENHACLAGYCTPKGRLLATMLVWNCADKIILQIPQNLQEGLQKRLQMYVMRAKVKLEHTGPSQVLFGILGQAMLGHLLPWFPTAPAAPYELVSNQYGTLLRLADSNGAARYQWSMDLQLADQIWPQLSEQVPALTEQDWALSEIHAGIPHLSVATLEKFVPQMINYELIGGVNFKKGCYPGQEIVARTHYLGKLKRRMALAHLDSNGVHAGMEVFGADDPTQPCGMVVNAAPHPAGGSDCLIEIKTAALEQGQVRLASGEICHWLPMPYSIAEANPDHPAAEHPAS